MARWAIRAEYSSLRGVVAFHDTGKIFEGSAEELNAELKRLRAETGRCHSAEAADESLLNQVKRGFTRLLGG